jgi:hypothetical protein
MHVYPEHHNTVVVVTTHRDVAATVTAWERRNGEWRATRMTVNAPRSLLDTIASRASALVAASQDDSPR